MTDVDFVLWRFIEFWGGNMAGRVLTWVLLAAGVLWVAFEIWRKFRTKGRQ